MGYEIVLVDSTKVERFNATLENNGGLTINDRV